MNLYVCDFPGHYLGGIAIIYADSPEEAERLTREEAAQSGLVGIEVEVKLHPPSAVIAYFWDGDY